MLNCVGLYVRADVFAVGHNVGVLGEHSQRRFFTAFMGDLVNDRIGAEVNEPADAEPFLRQRRRPGDVDDRVAVGQQVDQQAIIDRGVQPGETVVTDGQIRLTPKSKVTVKTSL